MKKIIKSIIEFFLWLFKGKIPVPKKSVIIYPEYKPTLFDFEIADLLNKYRFENKLPFLNFGLNKLLCNVAFSHSKYMAFLNNPSHDLFQQRADEFPLQKLGEIVAYNYNTPESTVTAWLNSPHHKSVIDNKDYVEIGIAKAVSSSGKNYVTVLFLSDK